MNDDRIRLMYALKTHINKPIFEKFLLEIVKKFR